MPVKILFLADLDSSHTRKWAVSLHQRGYEIGIFSLRKGTSGWSKQYPAIRVYDSEGFAKEKFQGSQSGKLSYLKMSSLLKKVIREYQPDLVHAHYATSYGLLGALSGFHPLITSVWGSDVFDFPKRSIFHRVLLKRNLRRADRIFSTSEVMKAEVEKLGIRNVVVTPFGVDTHLYKAGALPPLFGSEVKVIGTIKTLEAHYAIDVLIRAFAQLKSKYREPLKLVICGSGSQEPALRRLAAAQTCAGDIVFKGAITQDEVPGYMNRFDVFANLSLQESFGVAVVEAMACEVPVVVSDAPGLLEVTANGSCGLVVKRNDADAAAEAMFQLLTDSVLYEQMKEQGRRRVEQEYDWNRNLNEIEKQYAALLKQTGGRK